MMRALRIFIRINRSASAWLVSAFPRIFGNPPVSYRDLLIGRIAQDIRTRRPAVILEAGGVDRPLLRRSPDYIFVGLDIEMRPDCATLYDSFIVQSIEKPVPLRADMIVSYTLLEHVPDNRGSMHAMFASLNPGGTTHHYVPSRYHPYSISLQIVGPTLQKRLIPLLRPGAETTTGYPAFFNYCSPASMHRLMRETGFVDIDLVPFYRASDYFAFFLPLFILVTLFENLCAALGLRVFASGYVISARSPGEPAEVDTTGSARTA
ncbi:MAG: methyltransferase domain-containing protein [Pseudomonadota bacterium]